MKATVTPLAALKLCVCLLAGSVVLPVACGGGAFGGKTDGGEGGAEARGGSSLANAAAAHDAGRDGMGEAGAATTTPPEGGNSSVGAGGQPTLEAGAPGSTAGAVGEAGAAGSAPLGLCEEVGVGVEFGDHCYADVTADKLWTQAQAIGQCDLLGQSLGREGRILILDTPEEQAFVVEQFLTGLELTHDVWLGLMCPQALHPELSDCFCVNCTEDQLLGKRQNWLWPGGSSTGFGWHAVNPNGDGRCAALTYNATDMKWGWGDRDCLSSEFSLSNGGKHNYRIICEVK